jgi:hypothetical protein
MGLVNHQSITDSLKLYFMIYNVLKYEQKYIECKYLFNFFFEDSQLLNLFVYYYFSCIVVNLLLIFSN